MEHSLNLFIVLLLTLTFTSCSSVIYRSKQDVRIKSQSGTKIAIKDSFGNTIVEGEEQLSIKLDRAKGFFEKGNYVIEVTKEGYKPVTMGLTGEMNKGSYIVGNLLLTPLGTLLGMVVIDPLTGAMWSLSTTDGQKAENISIILKENVTGEMLDKAVKIK